MSGTPVVVASGRMIAASVYEVPGQLVLIGSPYCDVDMMKNCALLCVAQVVAVSA